MSRIDVVQEERLKGLETILLILGYSASTAEEIGSLKLATALNRALEEAEREARAIENCRLRI